MTEVPEEKPKVNPEDIGWKFMPDTENDVWGSLIIKANGQESDFWDNESNGFKTWSLSDFGSIFTSPSSPFAG